MPDFSPEAIWHPADGFFVKVLDCFKFGHRTKLQNSNTTYTYKRSYFKQNHFSSSGIGLAIANKLLAKGSMVTLIDINKQALNLECKRSIAKLKILALNITQEGLVADAIEEIISTYGKIDILIKK